MTYVNPQSVTAVGVLFPILGSIVVALRFYYSRQMSAGLGMDDWLCLPALLLLWVEGMLQVAGAAVHTFGWHSPSYSSAIAFLSDYEPNVEELGKLQTAFDLLHPIALGLLKLSICFFYRRIFRGATFNALSWIAIVTVVLWALAFTITIAAACNTHFDANWASLLVLKEECVDTFRMLLSYSATDVATDLLIIVTPMPFIFRLNMPLRRKLALCGVFLIGALAIACGITRLVIFVEVLASPLLATSTVAGLPATDDIGVVSLLLFWGMVELGVGMIAICLPTLRPLFAGFSLEAVIRSVRSAISLHSLGSQRGSAGGRSTHGKSRDVTKMTSEEGITNASVEGTTEPKSDDQGVMVERNVTVDWEANLEA